MSFARPRSRNVEDGLKRGERGDWNHPYLSRPPDPTQLASARHSISDVSEPEPCGQLLLISIASVTGLVDRLLGHPSDRGRA
jgi:hypothetical protein